MGHTVRAVNERSDESRGAWETPRGSQRVEALRAAYRDGRLLVSADPCALARARLEEAHAIDARDVADAVLRQLSGLARRGYGGRPPG